MKNEFDNLNAKVEELISNASDVTESVRQVIRRKWKELENQTLHILITGATGCGKSSTINALFNMDSPEVREVAKIGTSPDPETMDITKYEIGNMVLWDSPGLGDGKEADVRHSKNIIDKLNELNPNKKGLLIDLVLVILDGSTRDLGTSYELINKVIIPNLGEKKESRILVAINQADAAMGGRHWNREENRPDSTLVRFLDEKCESVRRRISEGTGVDITPIYYSAGFKEEGGEQEPPYNLAKLLYYILKSVPEQKRLVVMRHANTNATVWQDNDNNEEYSQKSQELAGISVGKYIAEGTALGTALGTLVPGIGTAVGAAAGAVLGAGIALAKKAAGGIKRFLKRFFS